MDCMCGAGGASQVDTPRRVKPKMSASTSAVLQAAKVPRIYGSGTVCYMYFTFNVMLCFFAMEVVEDKMLLCSGLDYVRWNSFATKTMPIVMPVWRKPRYHCRNSKRWWCQRLWFCRINPIALRCKKERGTAHNLDCISFCIPESITSLRNAVLLLLVISRAGILRDFDALHIRSLFLFIHPASNRILGDAILTQDGFKNKIKVACVATDVRVTYVLCGRCTYHAVIIFCKQQWTFTGLT